MTKGLIKSVNYPVLPTFVSKNWDKFILLIRTDFCPWSIRIFNYVKTPVNNFNFHYSSVLTIQIDFHFPKLYFSLLRALYTIENQSSNFVTIFCHMPHNSERKYAVKNMLKRCKNNFIRIFKTFKLTKCLQYSLSYIINLFMFYEVWYMYTLHVHYFV